MLSQRRINVESKAWQPIRTPTLPTKENEELSKCCDALSKAVKGPWLA
jgi:hypothetical protein